MPAPPSATEVRQISGALFMRGSAVVQDDDRDDESVVTTLIKGKSEKKRFFELVSIVPKVKRGGKQGLKQPIAELRYYTNDKKKLLGTIDLSATCEVTLIRELTVTTKSSSKNEKVLKLPGIKISTPGKTYVVRPIASSESEKASASVEASRWVTAMENELNKIFVQNSFYHMLSVPGRIDSSGLLSVNIKQKLSGVPERGGGGKQQIQETANSLPTTLDALLESEEHRSTFRGFLENALASESLDFYEALIDFERAPDASKMRTILDTYVAQGSDSQVNISSSQREALMKAGSATTKPTKSFFDVAKREVRQLMQTNFFKRFYSEEMSKSGAFAELYRKFGVPGWNAVLEHFGPARTDVERSVSQIESKVSRIIRRLEKLKKEGSSSREVAVSSQETTKRALAGVYATQTTLRVSQLIDLSDELEHEVLNELLDLKNKLIHDLEIVHESVKSELEELEKVESLYEASNRRLKKAFDRDDDDDEDENEEVLTGMSEEEMAKLRKRPSIGARLKKRLENMASSSGDSASSDSTNRLSKDEEIAAARDELEQAENARKKLKEVHTKAMVLALNKLESLELYRLNQQKKLFTHALLAEQNFMAEQSKISSSARDFANNIDVDRDLHKLVSSNISAKRNMPKGFFD